MELELHWAYDDMRGAGEYEMDGYVKQDPLRLSILEHFALGHDELGGSHDAIQAVA